MEQPTGGARSGCGPGDGSAQTREQIFMEHFLKMDEDISVYPSTRQLTTSLKRSKT